MVEERESGANRREFLWAIPGGCLLCGACQQLNKGEQALVDKGAQAPVETPTVHKFDVKTEITARQIAEHVYTAAWIPILERMAAKLGREKLIQLLQEASSEAATQTVLLQTAEERPLPIDRLAKHYEEMMKTQPLRSMVTFNIVEKTDAAFEYQVRECVFAETFRNAKAEDLGYAAICFADYAAVRAMNPDLKLHRDQTLMQGDSCCRGRISFEV